MNDNSTGSRRSRKATQRPSKPYPDFPLYPHPSGKWAKKIRGTIYYFGNWARREQGKPVRVAGDGWEEALKLYKAQADDLHAGRTPRTPAGELTIKALGDQFLTAKLRKVESAELTARSFQEYRSAAQLVADHFGKNRLVEGLCAGDFGPLRAAMARKWGPVRLSKTITCIKGMFKFAFDNALIDTPVRYGSEFDKPSKAVLRKHKAQNGERLLDAEQLRKLLDSADVRMKTLILLGINAGLGNTDVADLQLRHLDLDRGWLDYPRPKTGIARRCKLWPETVAAIRAAQAARPAPKRDEDASCVFLSEFGWRLVFVREREVKGEKRVIKSDAVTRDFGALLKRLGMHRAGISFYALRHTHRTVSDAARDPVACDIIMGHSDPSIGGHYRERVDDARLAAVVDHVHAWLWPNPATTPTIDAATVSEEAKPQRQRKAKVAAGLGKQSPAGSRPTLRLYVPETTSNVG